MSKFFAKLSFRQSHFPTASYARSGLPKFSLGLIQQLRSERRMDRLFESLTVNVLRNDATVFTSFDHMGLIFRKMFWKTHEKHLRTLICDEKKMRIGSLLVVGEEMKNAPLWRRKRRKDILL